MKFGAIPKLSKEELRSATLPTFIDKALPVINKIAEQALAVLNANVSLRENSAGKFLEFEDMKGSQLAALKINWDRKDQPLEIRICQLKRIKGSALSGSAAGFVGQGIEWPVSVSIPSVCVEQDGRALEIAKYPDAYAVLGTTYNTQTNPTTGGLWAAPAAGFFRVPDTRGLYKRHAGTSVRMVSAPGTASVAVSVGMVHDDGTAKNGLSNTSSTVSGNTVANNTGNQSADHTHTFSGTTSTESRGTWSTGAPIGAYGQTNATLATMTDSRHTHTFSGTTAGMNVSHTHGIPALSLSASAAAQTISGDTETRVRSRGVLNLIQVLPGPTIAVAAPSVAPDWDFDGTTIKASIQNLNPDAVYNVRIFIQS